MTKKPIQNSIVRSSAAEYLTFVAASGQGNVEAIYADENVWLTQKMMGLLYDVDVRTINYHLKTAFADPPVSDGEASICGMGYLATCIFDQRTDFVQKCV